MSRAPGPPGISPRWTSSAKSGVGTAASGQSRVWFTVSHGILNEVYFPRIDQANTRDLGFLIADGAHFFSEEKRDATHVIRPLAQGVPGYVLTSTCAQQRYRLHKTIITDPEHDVVLQRIRFETLPGATAPLRLYALLAPHLCNQGSGNNGWVGDYKGTTMLCAARNGTALALACSVPFKATSCGYVGYSDGWQDISVHKQMTWSYTEAPDGNIALTAEIDLRVGAFTLALGFGSTAAEAGQQARCALSQDFEHIVTAYVDGWQALQRRCLDLGRVGESGFDLYRVSTAVVATHEAKGMRGGMIASLSIPWGTEKSDNDLGGYHLLWPRDHVESAGALLAAGDTAGACRALLYLMATQEADGHWPQNMWLDGTPYWNGIQMDETAFPILLADAVRRAGALDGLDPWPMVRRAAGFLVCNGPVTQQDRWEEDGGFSPFTLAVEIAALLAAADLAAQAGEPRSAAYLRETADAWNDNVERWTYVSDTDLARQLKVDGYYVRIAPVDVCDAASPARGFVAIKNRPAEQSEAPAALIVSPDALALVRFGLRAPDDPRIRNTIAVIDATLRSDTATGPVWHRYTEDGYGEHEDGRPFDGTGIGRGWPLLAGERAHYELARGNREGASRLLHTMGAQASPGGLIPEQVWDATDVPDRELFNGRPSGSAMPLVWAHAEYVKLVRSLRDGKVFDLPPQTVQRYQVERRTSPLAPWRLNHKCRWISAGKTLRLEVLSAALVHWSTDEWEHVTDTPTQESGLGTHYVDLPTTACAVGTRVRWTFFWLTEQRWEDANFELTIG